MLSSTVDKTCKRQTPCDETLSVPKCVGVLHILIHNTVTSILSMPSHNAVNIQCDIQYTTHALDGLKETFCLLGWFVEAACLLSSVGCVNYSCVFGILSALYIFILWVRLCDVGEWKVCSSFFFVLQKSTTECSSSHKYYCLTVCPERGFYWDPLVCFVPCCFYSRNPSVPLLRCI